MLAQNTLEYARIFPAMEYV